MRIERTDLKVLVACRVCGYCLCCCEFKAAHPEGCQRRRAVLDEKPVPCKAHGTYACALCWPCDCGAATAPARSAAE